MKYSGADYEMAWPRELFVAEARELLDGDQADASDWHGRIELLLEEAFEGPAVRLAAVPDAYRFGASGVTKQEMLRDLLAHADQLVEAREPAAYWPQRRTGRAPPAVGPETVQRRFVSLLGDLSERGYLARAFPEGCVDDRDFVPVHKSDVLEERLGVPDLWPLNRSQPWDDDTFYGLIEVFHDLVARPRSRSWHDYGRCGWHWSDFALQPARVYYRWRINRLLDRSIIPLRIADEGEDTGRLIAVTDDARADLVHCLLDNASETTADRVRHAVALFRARTATAEDKRSAIITLAGILEERRPLIAARLYSKDEDALFAIANNFALRHHNERQRSDYDPAFLDWVFWWYAATVDLTDRLLARTPAS